MTTVAITGVSGLVGARVAQLLAGRDGVERLVGVDVRRPDAVPAGVEFRAADVCDPVALGAALDGCDVVVHLAFQLDQLRDEERMRAVNVDGSINVVETAHAVGVTKVVVTSSVVAYGAHADNDLPLTEESPLRACHPFPYAEHKQAVDEWLASWAGDHTDTVVTVLRPAMVMGPRVDNFIVRSLLGPRLLAVRGHRPPLQFVHVDDLAEAVRHVVEHDLPGAYNVAAEGWLSLDEVAAILGRGITEVPEEVAFSAVERAYDLQAVDLPVGAVHHFVHPWVASVDKLVATGWRPRHSNRDALAVVAEEQGDRLVLGRFETTRGQVVRSAGVGLAAAGGLLALGLAARRRGGGGEDEG